MRLLVLMIANVIVLKNALVVAKKTRIVLARSVIAAVEIAKNAIVENRAGSGSRAYQHG